VSELPSDLSSEAKLALMSLEEHPELNTPEAMSRGPLGIQEVDAAGYASGLRDLASRRLAGESAGRWFLIEQ
jgi:hypothetical protein